MKYLIVKCESLDDPYECDAYREPLRIVDDYTPYDKMGFDIHEIKEDGTLVKIRSYDEPRKEYIVCIDYKNHCKRTVLWEMAIEDIPASVIKVWKDTFNLTKTVGEIRKEIEEYGGYVEWDKNPKFARLIIRVDQE